jgi:hypothetical protein
MPALIRCCLIWPFNYRLHPFLIGILNHLILLVVGYLASLWFARRSPNRPIPAGPPATRNSPA